jgi:molybdopterin converting factor subunit 1
MKKVHVRYFAVLREQVGHDQETVETAASDLGELYGELSARYGFRLGKSDVKASVNLGWAPLEHPVEEGDEVVFIPPVAGG